MGEAVVLSKEVVVVAAEGDAADLPKSCDPEVCNKELWAAMVFDESGVFLINIPESKSERVSGKKKKKKKVGRRMRVNCW